MFRISLNPLPNNKDNIFTSRSTPVLFSYSRINVPSGCLHTSVRIRYIFVPLQGYCMRYWGAVLIDCALGCPTLCLYNPCQPLTNGLWALGSCTVGDWKTKGIEVHMDSTGVTAQGVQIIMLNANKRIQQWELIASTSMPSLNYF